MINKIFIYILFKDTNSYFYSKDLVSTWRFSFERDLLPWKLRMLPYKWPIARLVCWMALM